MSGFSKLLTTQNILIVLVVLVLLWAFYTYFYTKNSLFDNMTVQDVSSNPVPSTASSSVLDPSLRTTASQVVPNADGYNKIPTCNPSELLPKDKNSPWATVKGDDKNDVFIPSLLDAGYMIGLDTIGSTLKNPNLQIRSEPIIPKVVVSPWNQSSYENDLGRVPLEIGDCRA